MGNRRVSLIQVCFHIRKHYPGCVSDRKNPLSWRVAIKMDSSSCINTQSKTFRKESGSNLNCLLFGSYHTESDVLLTVCVVSIRITSELQKKGIRHLPNFYLWLIKLRHQEMNTPRYFKEKNVSPLVVVFNYLLTQKQQQKWYDQEHRFIKLRNF